VSLTTDHLNEQQVRSVLQEDFQQKWSALFLSQGMVDKGWQFSAGHGAK